MSLLAALKGKGPSGFGFGSTAEEVTSGLDLTGKTYLLTGCNSAGNPVSRLYRNESTVMNTSPGAPANLLMQLQGPIAVFSWDPASDSETPAAGLTYNLRIGVSSNGQEICPAMADGTSGYRRVARLGNANHNLSWSVRAEALWQPIYWSVQAVDDCFAGSAFAPEQTCTVGPVLQSITDVGNAGTTRRFLPTRVPNTCKPAVEPNCLSREYLPWRTMSM